MKASASPWWRGAIALLLVFGVAVNANAQVQADATTAPQKESS